MRFILLIAIFFNSPAFANYPVVTGVMVDGTQNGLQLMIVDKGGVQLSDRTALRAARNFAMENGMEDWLPKLARTDAGAFHKYVALINRTAHVEIPLKTASSMPLSMVKQDLTKEALDALIKIEENGRYVYRKGTFAGSRINMTGNFPSTWSFDFADIAAADYAERYGALGLPVDLLKLVG